MLEPGDVERDELDGDGDAGGAGEVDRGRLGRGRRRRPRATWQAGQLRSSVEPAWWCGTDVSPTTRDEGDENDDRPARAEQAFERPKRTGAARHGRRG